MNFRIRPRIRSLSFAMDLRNQPENAPISKRIAASAIAILLAALWMSFMLGCNGDETDDPSPVPSIDAEVIPDSSEVGIDLSLATVLSENDQRSGGVFRFFTGNGIIPDPVIETVDYAASWQLYPEIYAGLMKITDEVGAPTDVDLAERFTVSDDGLLYEFVLKQGLKFSDGTPVIASDFKWSWERALMPDTGSARSASILGPIEGAKAILDGTTTELSGVRVIDDRTLQVRLSSPRTDFLALLADPVATVLSQKNVESWGVQWKLLFEGYELGTFNIETLPVGTGPFKLVEYDLFNRRVLARNEHYHDRAAYLDGVELVMGLRDENDGRLLSDVADSAFDQAELDITWYDPATSTYDTADIEATGASVIFAETSHEAYFLTFNSSLEPYDDIQFRRALVAASDLSQWNRWWGDTAATALLPPEFSTNASLNIDVGTDVDLAMTELEASKYADEVGDLELTLATPSGGLDEEYEILFQQWDDVLNVDADYKMLVAYDYIDQFDVGEVEMKENFIFTRYPDPHTVLGVFDSMFGKPQISPEYAEAERMLHEASAEADAVKRIEKYVELERYILEQGLALPMFWRLDGYSWRVQPWVNDLQLPKYYRSMLKDVWIDTSHPQYPDQDRFISTGSP